ncbi:MAG: hypothetical protein Q7S96_01985 [bacterium]|nr:hypothetical protein [bacterium]
MQTQQQLIMGLEEAIVCSGAGGGPFAPPPAIPMHCPEDSEIPVDVVTRELYQWTWEGFRDLLVPPFPAGTLD